MSTFRVIIEVADLQRTRWQPVEVLVDTGSSFTTLPSNILEALGIQSAGSIEAQLADGRTVPARYGHAYTRVEGTDAPDLVMFAEPGEVTTLGAHSLEGHFLAVDPVNERLIPVPALKVRRSTS